MQRARVQNWFGDITSSPHVIVEVESVEEIVAIVTDRERYPDPVRAVGSNHSTTPCGVAESGTLISMRKMDRILEIREDTVTVQAGALYIDVNQELQKHNLQLHVNLEVGSLTMGSAAVCGTKDSSMAGEYGQAASYAIAIKMVTPDGQLVEVTETDPDLLQATRSSYGLFGIVYEVTFKVRPLASMQVYHELFDLEEFHRQLPALEERGEAMMLYIYPELDAILVEFRKYGGPATTRDLTTWQWRLRNYVWGHVTPTYARLVSKYIPIPALRDALLDGYGRALTLAIPKLLRGSRTLPQSQQIRYPAVSTKSRFTFSFWAFPEATYIESLRHYFEFCKQYYRETGFRANMLSVGYRVTQDQSSLFSYSFDGPVITFDPVSTGNEGWDQFLQAYNDHSSEMGGIPLLNQTKHLTRAQVRKALGNRLTTFEQYRRRFDPAGRLVNDYFRELLCPDGSGSPVSTEGGVGAGPANS